MGLYDSFPVTVESLVDEKCAAFNWEEFNTARLAAERSGAVAVAHEATLEQAVSQQQAVPAEQLVAAV